MAQGSRVTSGSGGTREIRLPGLRQPRRRYADFHSCRHLFITSRERAGIRPKVAQTLARHSDIRLTLNVHTHAGLADQAAAIGVLPGPPAAKPY